MEGHWGPPDWNRVGRNIRAFRLLQGVSKEALSIQARVSVRTVFRAERGEPVRAKSLDRICEALRCGLDEVLDSDRLLKARAPESLYVLNSADNVVWRASQDRRRRVSSNDRSRIQDPAERHRLGHQGLVPMFVGTMGFVMPRGPGVAFFELYESIPFDALPLYHELLFYCLRGEVTFTIGGERVCVAVGDTINPALGQFDFGPTMPVGRDNKAPVLMHIGGERITPYVVSCDP